MQPKPQRFRTDAVRRARTRRWLAHLFAAAAGTIAGCAHTHPLPNLAGVSASLEQRTSYPFADSPPAKCDELPYGISLGDELGENEAVLIALWHNAAFQETLADLGIARGDLIQAGLLPNPEFVYLFSVPDKPFRWALDFPLEALWLRPVRIAAAKREAERVSQRLTQAGLDLIRDVRQSYADAVLARGRKRVGDESLKLRGETLRLAEARLKAGDASVQEVATARIDVRLAEQDLGRLTYDVQLADSKLRVLLGLTDRHGPLVLDQTPPPRHAEFSLDNLLAEATRSRPDALAVEQAAAAAAERVRIAKLGWVRFLGIADATAGRATGHEFGPGARMTVPIFNWNQGNIARADAELDKFQRQRKTVHDQIVLDVTQAHIRYAQAKEQLQLLDDRVSPEVELAIRRAESGFKEGNTSYLVVLETTRQLLDSRLRREQLFAELRRAWADLERGVGRRLSEESSGLNCGVRLRFQEGPSR